MGWTERLARASAARPRRTFALWGVAVVVALGLVATSLHGLSSNGNVIGKPESTKAADEIAKAFPREAAAAKGDVTPPARPKPAPLPDVSRQLSRRRVKRAAFEWSPSPPTITRRSSRC